MRCSRLTLILSITGIALKQVELMKKSAVATFQTRLPCSFERYFQEGNELRTEISNDANSCHLCNALAESFICYS
jgi:hypothetical protein